MGNNVKEFKDKCGNRMALLIPRDYHTNGISFLTENTDYQQIAYMSHPQGHKIIPHYHNSIPRTIDYTCESLIMRKGIMAVDLYEDQKIIHTFQISEGDILTLFSGGHGFRVIEDVDMVEIKQGPYMGEKDKTRF